MKRYWSFAALIIPIIVACHASRPPQSGGTEAHDLNDALARARDVYQVTDWNTITQLDHLALLSSDGARAFAQQTEALKQDRGGYLCAGMATYLSYVLSSSGYRTATYNWGAGEFTHVVTLVDVGEHLALIDVFTGLVAPNFETVLMTLARNPETDLASLFQPLGRDLPKQYFAWLTRPGDVTAASLRAEFGKDVSIRPDHPDGVFKLDFPDASDCRAGPSRVLSCLVPPLESTTYETMNRGIESRTGVKGGAFLMPLNVYTSADGLFDKFPFLRLLDAQTRAMASADAAKTPDHQLFQSLVASLRRSLVAMESRSADPEAVRPG